MSGKKDNGTLRLDSKDGATGHYILLVVGRPGSVTQEFPVLNAVPADEFPALMEKCEAALEEIKKMPERPSSFSEIADLIGQMAEVETQPVSEEDSDAVAEATDEEQPEEAVESEAISEDPPQATEESAEAQPMMPNPTSTQARYVPIDYDVIGIQGEVECFVKLSKVEFAKGKIKLVFEGEGLTNSKQEG